MPQMKPTEMVCVQSTYIDCTECPHDDEKREQKQTHKYVNLIAHLTDILPY